jgi:ACR3 family arsenite efflux pump ArsB
MDDGHYRKRLTSFVGLVAGILAVGLLVVTIAPSGRDIIGGPGSLMGWAVPLVALFVIIAITWFLIVRDSRTESDDGAQRVTCWSCAHVVQSEWRLCPYCGAELRAWASPDRSLGHN